MTATVKWFNDWSGYGFATMDDGQDVFLHKSQLKGFKTLKPNQRIRFDLYESGKGKDAKNIELEDA